MLASTLCTMGAAAALAPRLAGKESSLRKTLSFLAGLFVGAFGGYLAGLLLAPRSGEETRQDLSDRAIVLRERAEETADRVIHEIQIARQGAPEIVAEAADITEAGEEGQPAEAPTPAPDAPEEAGN